MAVLLKTASVRVSSIQIMQVRVQNKGKSVWKSRYVGDVLGCRDNDPEDSMPDTSIDTETWDQLGSNVREPPVDKDTPEPGALAVLDTAGSSPPTTRSLERPFD